MGTAAWVCFHCRSAVRRHTHYGGDVPCPNCSRPCTWIGHKIPVPPKRKQRDWSALHAWLARQQADRDMQVHVARIRECTALRQEIDRLEARAPNAQRSQRVRRLRRRLEHLGG
jgi:hypothetical protein